MIAVQGDPLADVRLLQHVSFVMKSGVVYKNEAQPDSVDRLPAVTAALGTETRPGAALAGSW